MILKQINIKNFRNFILASFSFNPFLTVVIGENAKGKTNLLEAIYLALYGEGFRESKEDELIRFDQNNADVQASFASGDESFLFQISIKKNLTAVQKVFSINKSKKKHFLYQRETPKVVLFSPEQIEMITGSPEKRRKYLDFIIGSFDIEYRKRLINYENALRKRNKVLEIYKDNETLKSELSFWNSYLEENGEYLTRQRQGRTDFLNVNREVDSKEFRSEYKKNEFNISRLEEYFEIEKRYRKTVIGPQKDDFQISQKQGNKWKNIHHFGSRSEQRLGVFWLKFNEVKFLEENLKTKPLLLLDDVFSELDIKNKKLIIDLVKKYQTIVTTTEIKLLDLIDMPKSIITL